MPSLPQLLTDHGSLLVFDAASTQVQVGLLRQSTLPIWLESAEESGAATFTLAEKVLSQGHVTLSAIGAFVFCEGPGSMLGIRTVAMALRTWQTLSARPAYAYQSLAVAGRFEWTKSVPRQFAMIADARRDSWHYQSVNADGHMAPLARIATAALPAIELVTPENFRVWSAQPATVHHSSYRLAEIFPTLADGDYFRATSAPDAFQHEAPDYKKWTAQIHSAATAPQK